MKNRKRQKINYNTNSSSIKITSNPLELFQNLDYKLHESRLLHPITIKMLANIECTECVCLHYVETFSQSYNEETHLIKEKKGVKKSLKKSHRKIY